MEEKEEGKRKKRTDRVSDGGTGLPALSYQPGSPAHGYAWKVTGEDSQPCGGAAPLPIAHL